MGGGLGGGFGGGLGGELRGGLGGELGGGLGYKLYKLGGKLYAEEVTDYVQRR